MSLSVYIHLPYCLHKCPYCDFNTYAIRDFPERRYAEAIGREIKAAAASPAWAGRAVSTVFFGGGTPSLFQPATIADMMGQLAALFGFADDPEVTLEANPGTLEGGGLQRLKELRAVGVNRLSIGCQSFSKKELGTLGRLHTAEDSARAIEAARSAGFDSISGDLIFAVPGQTVGDWEGDLEALIELGPDHVSTYNLTYETGTPMTVAMAKGHLARTEEDTEAEMYELAIDRLAGAGYRHYEISNFARPGHPSVHNMAYWTWRDYLGLGAGAHGFGRERPGTIGGGTSGFRYSNLRGPEDYMSARNGARVAQSERLERKQAMSEFVMLGLRVIDGFIENDFDTIFGCSLEEASPSLDYMCSRGFIERAAGRVRLTRRGLMLADSVITKLAAA